MRRKFRDMRLNIEGFFLLAIAILGALWAIYGVVEAVPMATNKPHPT